MTLYFRSSRYICYQMYLSHKSGHVIFPHLALCKTLPRGERRRISDRRQSTSGFQSTLPRGERPGMAIMAPASQNFNPRSREGSDILFSQHDTLNLKFQSTLPRGERPRQMLCSKSPELFQSTLPRGERRQS